MTKLNHPAILALLLGGTLISHAPNPAVRPYRQDVPSSYSLLLVSQDTYDGPARTAGPRVNRT